MSSGGLSVFLDEPLLIRLFVSCLHMPAPVWTPLDDLFAFVHSEVVSVFLQLSPQGLYGYYQFCYHTSPFFVLSIWGPQIIFNFWGERRHKSPLPISGVVWSLRSYCRTQTRPFRDHPEPHRIVRGPFSNHDANIR